MSDLKTGEPLTVGHLLDELAKYERNRVVVLELDGEERTVIEAPLICHMKHSRQVYGEDRNILLIRIETSDP
jgi:hypothetical protein